MIVSVCYRGPAMRRAAFKDLSGFPGPGTSGPFLPRRRILDMIVFIEPPALGGSF